MVQFGKELKLFHRLYPWWSRESRILLVVYFLRGKKTTVLIFESFTKVKLNFISENWFSTFKAISKLCRITIVVHSLQLILGSIMARSIYIYNIIRSAVFVPYRNSSLVLCFENSGILNLKKHFLPSSAAVGNEEEGF